MVASLHKESLEEYKKFLYLACEAGHPVTPSDQVDQAWHQHLFYTHSYWDEMCKKTLGKAIHHGPTRGGDKEREKFEDWYVKTLESYKKHFGESPDPTIWPNAKQRFPPTHIQRVDTNKAYVTKKNYSSIAVPVSA